MGNLEDVKLLAEQLLIEIGSLHLDNQLAATKHLLKLAQILDSYMRAKTKGALVQNDSRDILNFVNKFISQPEVVILGRPISRPVLRQAATVTKAVTKREAVLVNPVKEKVNSVGSIKTKRATIQRKDDIAVPTTRVAMGCKVADLNTGEIIPLKETEPKKALITTTTNTKEIVVSTSPVRKSDRLLLKIKEKTSSPDVSGRTQTVEKDVLPCPEVCTKDQQKATLKKLELDQKTGNKSLPVSEFMKSFPNDTRLKNDSEQLENELSESEIEDIVISCPEQTDVVKKHVADVTEPETADKKSTKDLCVTIYCAEGGPESLHENKNGRPFVNKSEVYQERKDVKKDVPPTCNECGKTFSSISNLKVHSRSHLGDKPFCCAVCSKKFTTKANMERHERSHLGIKLYECRHCSKRFGEKKVRDVHERIHTGLRPHSCVICGAAFSQRATLLAHMHLHTGYKGELCDICGKSFRQKTQLKQHKLRHSGLRIHQCTKCEASFSVKGDLARHLTKHDITKAFTCSMCPRSFSRPLYLKDHLNSHTGNYPYHCHTCPAAYQDKSSYQKHLRKEHSKPISTITTVGTTSNKEESVWEMAVSSTDDGNTTVDSGIKVEQGDTFILYTDSEGKQQLIPVSQTEDGQIEIREITKQEQQDSLLIQYEDDSTKETSTMAFEVDKLEQVYVEQSILESDFVGDLKQSVVPIFNQTQDSTSGVKSEVVRPSSQGDFQGVEDTTLRTSTLEDVYVQIPRDEEQVKSLVTDSDAPNVEYVLTSESDTLMSEALD